MIVTTGQRIPRPCMYVHTDLARPDARLDAHASHGQLRILNLARSRAAIKPDDGPIEHRVLNGLAHHLGKLTRPSGPFGELECRLKAGAHFRRHHARHLALEKARGYRDAANAVAGQVPRHGERHAGDCPLAGRVRELAFLAVERGRARNHDDDAALSVGIGVDFGDFLDRLAHEVDGAAQVDTQDQVKVVHVEGGAIFIENLALSVCRRLRVKYGTAWGIPLPAGRFQQRTRRRPEVSPSAGPNGRHLEQPRQCSSYRTHCSRRTLSRYQARPRETLRRLRSCRGWRHWCFHSSPDSRHMPCPSPRPSTRR
ncbi:hypothetical protein G6O67_007475 [Ophiocordyceps sinensis]|uniref:Uncharacterized protein n=1 Tax=Ophiocordyceps sinensis TaxID=72228 RepID=A0A8H4PL37_9HYPO|nr:hypothetical protein G6O67_007475 [Ophiocordyceps sinensis]